jgi:hypothetical protein
MARDKVDMFVLDSLANDIESLADVMRIINSDSPELGWRDLHPAEFSRVEVLTALKRLTRDELVSVLRYSADGATITNAPPTDSFAWEEVDDLYFAMSERGRMVHRAWDPPTS